MVGSFSGSMDFACHGHRFVFIMIFRIFSSKKKGSKINQLIFSIQGILLGNFVPSTGPALEKGQFVGVSAPIGKPFSLLIH
jgi:hypothetical protein